MSLVAWNEHGTNTTGPAISVIPHHAEQALREPRCARLGRLSNSLQSLTPFAVLVCYVVFSLALYLLAQGTIACEVLWFFYLTLSTIRACTIALEAYNGSSMQRQARKATARFGKDAFVSALTTDYRPQPAVELIFDNVAQGRETMVRNYVERAVQGYSEHQIKTSILTGETLREYVSNNPTACPYSAVFSGSELPHPWALRLAVDRLQNDSGIDVVQSRLSSVGPLSPTAAMASFRNDLNHGLVLPGRSSTWGLSVGRGSGTFWRTEALRVACDFASRSNPTCLLDLAYAAYWNGAGTVQDLSIVSFSAAAASPVQWLRMRATAAAQHTRCTLKWSKLVILDSSTGENPKKRGLKTRLGLLVELSGQLLTDHLLVQFACLFLLQLSVNAPHTSRDFANLIYWTSPVSRWFIIASLISSALTVAMTYLCSDLPIWTLPIALVIHLPTTGVLAIAGIYGQLTLLLSLK